MSCHSCVIWVNGSEVYGTVVQNATALRFQVWSREWETLGFTEGQTVAVRLPGRSDERFLIADVVRVPDTGNTWVHFAVPLWREVKRVQPKVRLLRSP